MEKIGEVRNLMFFGEAVLREHAETIAEINEDIVTLAMDMKATLARYGGIGLAAPQVGESVRMIAVGVNFENNDKLEDPLILINPVIVESDAKQMCNEGCLSIPTVAYQVERPGWVRVKGLTLDGKEYESTATDLGAAVLDHEIDHLNGVLFIDHLSALKKDIAIRKAKKFNKMYRRVMG